MSNTICPIVEYSAGEEYRPKAGHVIVSPFGSCPMAVPKFFICEMENKMGTSPVSSTSTLVEHGGAVGKWTMQLSTKVSVSELADTKDLLQRQDPVVTPWYLACFFKKIRLPF